jgi:hypothetical protein
MIQLPTVKSGQWSIDLSATPTVLLTGPGSWQPVAIWLEEHGAFAGHGGEYPGVSLALAFSDDFEGVFAALPLDQPAIVHLALDDDEALPDAALSTLPAHAALIVTMAGGTDDPAFSAFGRYEGRTSPGHFIAELREQRGFVCLEDVDFDYSFDFEDECWAPVYMGRV